MSVLTSLFRSKDTTKVMTELTVTTQVVGNSVIRHMSNPKVPVRDIRLKSGKLLTAGSMVTKSISGIPGNIKTTYITLSDKTNKVRPHALLVEEYPIDYMADRFQQFKRDLGGRGRIMVTGVRTTIGVASRKREVTILRSWTMEEFYRRYRAYIGNTPDPILKMDREKVKRELGFEVEDTSILTTVRNVHGLIVFPTPILQKDPTGVYDYLLLGFGLEE